MAANWNITGYVGDDIAEVLRFRTDDRTTAVDLTGYTWSVVALNADETVAVTFTTTCNTPASGNLTVSLTDTQTTALGAGSWDLKVRQTVSGITTTILVGTFTLAA